MTGIDWAAKAQAFRRRDQSPQAAARRQARARTAKAQAATHSIYFIACGDYVKIGVSAALDRRLKEMATGNPFPLRVLATIPGGSSDEAALHRKFALDHHRDEWFYLRGALAEYIKDIVAKPENEWRATAAPKAVC